MGKRSREKRERREKGEIEPKREKPENGLISVCKWVIFIGTFLLLFTPLIISSKFLFPFVGPKSLYFMGLSQIVFFAWLVLIIFSPRYRPRWNPILIALILFLAVLILVTIFGTDPSRSFWSKPERMTGLLMWFHLIAFFLVISSVFKTKDDWINIFSISIFVGVILSFIAFFSGDPYMRGGATIGNDSFLGTYLLFELFLALYLIFTAENEIKIYSAIFFLITFLALFLSGARAAKLSFLGGIFLLFFLYLAFIPQKRLIRILGKILLIGSLLAFLTIAFFVFQPNSIIQQKFMEKATKARLVVWEKAWKGFLERPWLGWGPENFEFVFSKHFNPCMFLPLCGGEIWFDRAHNIILDTLVATGILGLIAYIGIFLAAFYVLWRKYFKKEVNFWLAGIFSTALIAYSVQNLTVFDMINSYLMFFLVLGFIGSIVSGPEKVGEERKLILKNFYLAIILICFIFSFSKFVVKPIQTDYYAIASLRQRLSSPEKLSLYKKTLETSPLGRYQIRDFFAQNTLELAARETAKGVPLGNFKQEMEFLSQELEKSIKEAPLDFRSFLKLGQIYNTYSLIDAAKLSRAEEVLKKAIELSPTNQQGYWALAQTKIYQGRINESLPLAEKALSLEPGLLQSHLIVVQIAKLMGDNNLAKEKIKEAVKINPDWEAQLKKVSGE